MSPMEAVSQMLGLGNYSRAVRLPGLSTDLHRTEAPQQVWSLDTQGNHVKRKKTCVTIRDIVRLVTSLYRILSMIRF